ncbi:MAG: hypothetical protein K2N51_05085 [Lachnospiraceae bacterium]|nr:hypothetical protein [Lachnospiraceae bacterium]
MRDKKLIQLYITNMCNSHCKTCGIWKNKERQELQFDDIIKILAAFPDVDYVIGGGEAILHDDIVRILNLLSVGNINYTLLSNCILVGTVCKLVETFSIPSVTISCDGINHNKIRGVEGNLESINMFRKFCITGGIKFKVSYTYSRYNEESFLQDMDMFRNMGLNEIYFCIAQDMDLLMTAESDESFVAKNFEQILDCELISEKDKNHIRSMITGKRRCCTSQNNVHTIYSNGDIVRCQSFKSNIVLGNIKDMTTEEIRLTLNSVNNRGCRFDEECNLLCQRRYD